MLQLWLKYNTVLYLHATYEGYLERNIHTRETKEKWGGEGRRTGTFWCKEAVRQRNKRKLHITKHIFRNLVIVDSRPPYGI